MTLEEDLLVLRDVDCRFLIGHLPVTTFADVHFTSERMRLSATDKTGQTFSYVRSLAEKRHEKVSALVDEFFINYSDMMQVQLLKKDWPQSRWQRARLNVIYTTSHPSQGRGRICQFRLLDESYEQARSSLSRIIPSSVQLTLPSS